MHIFFFLLYFFPLVLFADNYAIFFTDKAGSTYSIDRPEEFLSLQAIERRNKIGKPIDYYDLPLSASYMHIVQQYDIVLTHKSKWLNAIVIESDNPAIIDDIENLAFVQEVIPLTSINQDVYKKDKLLVEYKEVQPDMQSPVDDHGFGKEQITMLQGDVLHNLGFTGEGIEIAVMDNGFTGVDNIEYFNPLFAENRIVSVYNYVNNDNNVFDGGNHGTSVLSTMASDKSQWFIGTAPDATYYLFVTEDNQNEGLAEEINWAIAAEKADSMLGPHSMRTTSLGYSTGFNNPADEHTYADMDGNTTIITKAADLAASRGILIVNSAGNEGNSSWHYITAPADGDSVLAIGAVDEARQIVDFSSRGPSADGDLKPNVCAQGALVTVLDPSGSIQLSNGTSFSCPITTGMAACLWQAFPQKNNMEIFNAIQQSADRYDTPDNDYGYGIPNFKKAFLLLLNQQEDSVVAEQVDRYRIFPNPVEDIVFIKSEDLTVGYTVQLYSINGKLIDKKNVPENRNLEHEMVFSGLNALNTGIYILRIQDDMGWYLKKIVKL